MFEMCNEIEIPASPREVWSALVDFPRYSKWNPYVQIRGVAGSETEIQWSLGSTLLKRRIWMTALVTGFYEPLRLSWSLGSSIFAVEECFSLEVTQTGTRLQHRVRCRGLVATVARGHMRKTIERIVTTSDKRLCRYFEGRAKSMRLVAPGANAARGQNLKKRRPTHNRRRR